MIKLPGNNRRLSAIQAQLIRNALLIFVVVTACAYGFLVYQINRLTQIEPSAEQVSEKLEAVTRPRIDQNSVDRLNQLEAENIEVKTMFDEARNNPFTE